MELIPNRKTRTCTLNATKLFKSEIDAVLEDFKESFENRTLNVKIEIQRSDFKWGVIYTKITLTNSTFH